MFAIAFLNPMLLAALPLCAVPIVIHLLNRRRYRRVPWAAMEYLLAAMKRNRKRLRMEQWLVLLLRTLAVLFLVALVARPQLGGGGGLLGTRTHHVVLLDDSASMTQRTGSTTLFDKAQDRLRVLVEDLGHRRGGDVLSVVRTSRPTQPDLWAQRIGPETARRVTTIQKEWTVGDGAPDLGQVLHAAVKRAAEVPDAARTEFLLVTDQRAHDWASEDDKPKATMLAALAAMTGDDRLSVLAVGGQNANVGVVDVRLLDRLTIAGVPANLAVDVQNLGLDPIPAGSVAVEVDGQSRVSLVVPALAPGERVAMPVGHTFHQAGFHRVEARLEPTETYPLDDRRTLVLDVRAKSRVLLVDGQPDEEDGETFYLQAAMDIAESGIEPVVVTESALAETDLASFDLVWLCNVQAPSPLVCQRIEAWVANGGGLVIACGNQVDPGRYDELLWRDGNGLLPAQLGEIGGDPDKPEPATLVGREHPVCAGVAEVMEILVANVVLVKRWLGVVEDPKHPPSVVIRVRDNEGPPLLVTRAFGGSGGQVALFTVTADKFWSNLPSTDLFVVLCNQIHRFAAKRADQAGDSLLPAGSYRLQIDPATHRADVTVRAIGDADERTFTATESPANATPGAPAAPQPLSLVVPMSELRRVGPYEVELSRHDGAPDRRLFARNAPTAESRLVGFLPSSFVRLYPNELHSRVTFVADDGVLGAERGEGELWKILAFGLLVGLVLESLLAWRFGRR